MTELQDLPRADLGLLADWYQANNTNLPVLPDVASRVIDVAANPHATVSQLAQAISIDQVLTTRLLSLANSAYAASVASITNIPQAVMRIGTTGVRNLAVAVCFASRMHDRRVYGDQGKSIVMHGVATAYVARMVAREADVNADEAFLCGLLHDIGKLVLLKWYHEHQRRTATISDAAEVQDVIAKWHATVAGVMLRRAKLPRQLEEPIVCHHDYQQATGNRQLAAVVYLANRLSHRWGFGCAADGFDPREDIAAWELGLDPLWLDSIDERAPGILAEANQVLGN